jgi:hypothetical protein
MVVGFTTTYTISAYHYWCCEFESQITSIQYKLRWMNKLVSNTYCVVLLFCLFSSCVFYVANFSELSIFNWPSVFSNTTTHKQTHITTHYVLYTTTHKQTHITTQYVLYTTTHKQTHITTQYVLYTTTHKQTHITN